MEAGISEQARLDEAADWLARLRSEEASEDDWRAFTAWLAADPAHRAAYDRAEALWDALGSQTSAQLQPSSRSTGPAAAPPPRRRRLPLALAAALAVAAAGVGSWLGLGRNWTYATRPGEIRNVSLPDGTSVQINGASRLAISYRPWERQVRMQDSEAAFEVAHDPRRPFRVQTGLGTVQVVGTRFDVLQEGDRLVVSVARGAVRVTVEGAPAAVVLKPGQQLIHHGSGGADELRSIRPEDAFPWREGRLVYRDAPLTEVAADLKRRLGLDVAIAPSARDLRFTGVLSASDAAEVRTALETLLPVQVQAAPQGLIVTSRS